MTTSNNPPAFPCEAQGDRNVPPEHDYIQTGIYSSKFPGMSLRDWFAGQALAGLIAQSSQATSAALVANEAYTVADAMLSARSVRSETDV